MASAGLFRRILAVAAPSARATVRGERGALLAEVLMAITIITIVGTGVLAAASNNHRIMGSIEHQAVLENTARNQMEMVLAAEYKCPDYDYSTESPELMVEPPPGHTVTAEAFELNPGESDVAKVSVSVLQDGEALLTVEVIRTQDPASPPCP